LTFLSVSYPIYLTVKNQQIVASFSGQFKRLAKNLHLISVEETVCDE
jgi:hypothetical protein